MKGRVVIPDTLPLRGDWYAQGAPPAGRPSDASARSAYRVIVSGPLRGEHARLSEAVRGRSSGVRDLFSWYQGDILVFDCEEAYN